MNHLGFAFSAMGKAAVWLQTTLCAGLVLFSVALAFGWECSDPAVTFRHEPSDYYGSGQFFSQCPADLQPIRCYHYHRHWVCEKQDTLYWDRNLQSAARAACRCPLPQQTRPAAPAVTQKPAKRIF
jgi:hypothetical protein